MLFYIFMGLAGVFGLVCSFRAKSQLAKVITWMLVAALAWRLVPVSEVSIDGYYLFAMAEFLVIIYAFSSADFSTTKKIVLAALGGLSLIPLLLFLFGHSGLTESLVSAVLVPGIYLYVLIKEIKSFKDEIGFLTILAADALVRLYILASLFMASEPALPPVGNS